MVNRGGEVTKEAILEAIFPFTQETVMLVDDSISRGSTLISSTAPGERGGSIQLLDLPLEADGLNAESMAQLRAMVGGDGGIAELAEGAYDTNDAPLLWNLKCTHVLVKDLSMKPSALDPMVFKKVGDKGELLGGAAAPRQLSSAELLERGCPEPLKQHRRLASREAFLFMVLTC